MTNPISLRWTVLAAIGLLTASATADVPYFNGFEAPANVNDFYGPPGIAGGNIVEVPSGAGVLGYTAAAGANYAEIHNTDNYAGAGFGYAGATYFGSETTGPASGFAESLDIYVDTARWLPTLSPGSDFVISTTPIVVHDQGPDFNNVDFAVTTAGVIQVSAVPGSNLVTNTMPQPLATITTSGWYQLLITFVPGTTYLENDVSVLDAMGNTLGTVHGVSTVPAGNLVGNGETFFGPWQNGFAGDVLGIDNLQTYAVPEPALLGVAPLFLALRRRSQ